MTTPIYQNHLKLKQLSEQVTSLQKKLKTAIWLASVALAGLSAIGYSKLADIETKAKERVDTTVKESVEYFDNISNAQARTGVDDYASAATYYERAYALKMDDEFTFSLLLDAYANDANITAGLKLLENADRSGMLVRKFTSARAQLSAARMYMLAGLKDEKYISFAQYHFDRAERMAQATGSGDLSYVLYSSGIYRLLIGEDGKAKSILEHLVEFDPKAKKWPEGDRLTPWFQQLLKVRPTLQDDLEAMLVRPDSTSR